MKHKYCLIFALLVMALAFSTAFAFANTGSETKPITNNSCSKTIHLSDQGLSKTQKDQLEAMKKKYALQGCSYSYPETDDEGKYLKVYYPEPWDTYYLGEKMGLDYEVFDTWENYFTVPGAAIFDSDDEIIDDFDGEVAEVNEWTPYEGTRYINPSKYEPGSYELTIWNIPCYSDGSYVSDWSSWDNVPEVTISFTVKKLKPPTKLSLKTEKKKVTIRFKKAAGATKYEIYRSLKKSSGFKKIGSTKSAKYVDKKAKKGKRYYYKIKSVRSVNGTVRSAYSGIKRSKKVK